MRARGTVLRAVRRGPYDVNMAWLVEALISPLGNAEAECRGVLLVPTHIDALKASNSKGLAGALRPEHKFNSRVF